MAQSYEVRPSNRRLKGIGGGIDAIPLSYAAQRIIEMAYIYRVIVNVDERQWRLTLYIPEVVPDDVQKEVKDAVQKAVGGISRVEIEFFSKQDLPPVQERIILAWPRIIRRIKEEMPSMSGWLLENEPRCVGDTVLEWTLKNKAGVEFFNRRLEYLQNLIWEETGEALKIALHAEPVEEVDADWEEAQRQQEAYLASLVKEIDNAPKERKPSNNETNNNYNNGNGYRGRRRESSVLGKNINGEPRPIREITEEENGVIIQGEVFRFETKTLKSGKSLWIMDITDQTDSLTIKVFQRGSENLAEKVNVGSIIKVKGDVQMDRFANELNLLVNELQVMPPKEPLKDEADVKRVELHLHTKMSAMDSTLDVARAIKTAASWGHPAIAITDHGVVQAFPEAYQVAKKAGIKVLYGLEGYLINDGEPIIARAPAGSWKDQTFMIVDIETTGFYPGRDQIIEIGAVRLKNGKIIDSFQTFVRPEREIPRNIQELTGITPNMVKDAPAPAEALQQFLSYAGDAIWAAHNASFDFGFLRYETEKYLGQKLAPPLLDTLVLSRILWPSWKNHKLGTAVKELGINLENHHRANDDARATGELLQKALTIIGERGIDDIQGINTLTEGASLDSLRSYHIIILVQNMVGLKNLYRLVSKAHVDYFHRHPRIPRSLLTVNREGLILGSACEAGELYQALLENAPQEKIRAIADFYDYLEIQPLGNNEFMVREGRVTREDLQELNKRIIELGKALNKPVVATGDVHFYRPEEAIFREILLAGQGFEDASHQAPLYLRTTNEMLQEFDYLSPEVAREVVIDNPVKIAESIEVIKPVPDEFFPPIIEGADDEIREMAYKKGKEVYGDPLPQVVADRLEWELKSIIGHGYAVLYLIAQKLVKRSMDDNYLVGSRGSVGSSLVANFCGITEVNALPAHYLCTKCKHSEFFETGAMGSGYDLPPKNCPNCGTDMRRDGQDIPFATFMGFEGDKEPDIDLNFSGDYQPVIHKYTEELFGKDYTFRAGTITTLAEKTAFGFVRGYLEDKHIKARTAEINRLVAGTSGVRRSTGQHPGGMMVVPKGQDILNFTPVQYPANDKSAGWITTHFDYHSLSGRLVKLDILGHDDPTVIRMLQDITGIDPKTVPLNDPETMRIFSSIEPLGLKPEDLGFNLGTLGIPEFGTEFVRQMLEETQPTTFAELLYISGLSHGTNVWLGNAQELIKNGTAKLSEVICTRDDIMNYLIFKGCKPKFAFTTMEKVRKGKGLTDEDIEEMKKHDVPQWYIDSCLKIKYMFPKAHAVAYVMMAFRIAYFKVHYPNAFYATYFTVRADEFDADITVKGLECVNEHMDEIRRKGNEATQKEKNLLTILEIVKEAMLRGIKFLPVELYKSDAKRFLITPDGLLPPLAALQGLGENAAKSLALAREEGAFTSIEDLKTRARLSSAIIEVLQKHGCLEGLPETDQLTLF
jgi:DNA polymerase-3 subunit alpha (Gram-positive type)